MSTPSETLLLIAVARAIHSIVKGPYRTDIAEALKALGVGPERPAEQPEPAEGEKA